MRDGSVEVTKKQVYGMTVTQAIQEIERAPE